MTSDTGKPTTDKWSMENAKTVVETSKNSQTSPNREPEKLPPKCDVNPEMEKGSNTTAWQMDGSKVENSKLNNVQTGAAEIRKITSESTDTMTIGANQDVNQRQSNAVEATSSSSNSSTVGSNPSIGIQPPHTTKNLPAETIETKIKHARDMFFNVEPKTSQEKEKPQPKLELQNQSSVDEMEDLEADQVTEIAVEDKDPSPGDDTRHEQSSDDHAKLMDPFSESQYSDSTRCSVDRFSESGRSTDSEMRSEDEDEYEEAQSKAKLFRPCAVAGAAAKHAMKTGRIQIPDITITESSDSEGEAESESEFEMECYRDTSYDRTFPTILYDITEVDEPFSDASDMEFSSYSEDK